MKSIQLSKVHYEMLVTIAKKAKRKPEQYLEEFIQVQFTQKTKGSYNLKITLLKKGLVHRNVKIVNISEKNPPKLVHVAESIEAIIKPHQIGGVRFLYDNIIESPSVYEKSSGFGCILANLSKF